MDPDVSSTSDPEASLERSFIEEFLKTGGHTLATLHDLPPEQATALMKAASRYASARLAEVETRAHFIDSIHGDVDLTGKR
jgi:aminoglycoside phosphotransferase (APT) family kinase protein